MVLGFIEHLAQALEEKIGEDLISVVLYGSYARGQIQEGSDVDLLIVARNLPPSSLDRQVFFNKILLAVEEPFRKNLHGTGFSPYISAILKTPEEAGRVSRFYFDMVDEAKIFLDRDDFFKSVLERVEKRLKDLGAKKIQVGKMWYWDLKPDYRPGDVFEI
jgi:uncharacterized protein